MELGRSELLLHLVRHGESVWNAEKRLTGWTDVGLSETGRAQAMALRPTLERHRFDAVWASDLSRAIETARLAHSEPRTDRRLRELDFGALEGKRWDVLAEMDVRGLREFGTYRAPDGESLVDLESRVEAFLEELPAGRHLVFTHGGVIRALVRRFGAREFVSNTTVVVLNWTARRVVEVVQPSG